MGFVCGTWDGSSDCCLNGCKYVFPLVIYVVYVFSVKVSHEWSVGENVFELFPVGLFVISVVFAGNEERIGGELENDRNMVRADERAGGKKVMKVKSGSVGENKVRAALTIVSETSGEVGAKEFKVFVAKKCVKLATAVISVGVVKSGMCCI